jgi:hypothetical protein
VHVRYKNSLIDRHRQASIGYSLVKAEMPHGLAFDVIRALFTAWPKRLAFLMLTPLRSCRIFEAKSLLAIDWLR